MHHAAAWSSGGHLYFARVDNLEFYIMRGSLAPQVFPLLCRTRCPISDSALSCMRAQVSYLHHRELVAPVVRRSIEKIAYYRIAAHYRFILGTFFDCFKYPRLIILEASCQYIIDFMCAPAGKGLLPNVLRACWRQAICPCSDDFPASCARLPE